MKTGRFPGLECGIFSRGKEIKGLFCAAYISMQHKQACRLTPPRRQNIVSGRKLDYGVFVC